MSIRVYQYGLLRPNDNELLVRKQIRAAHEYRNQLVAIERGRRYALRLIDEESPEVLEAREAVKNSTRSTRKAAVTALRAARKKAREGAETFLDEIAAREHETLLWARSETPCYWGTYLDIENAHRQSRGQPLYGDDAITPNDPSFVRGPRWEKAFPATDPRGQWWLAKGQVGVQLQNGITVPDIMTGKDSRVRILLDKTINRGRRAGTLWLRIGSEGRDPIWAKWPILMHRPLPENAKIKWVRVSVRPEGLREHWTVEITLDDPSPDRRLLTAPSTGAVAVQWEWNAREDGSICVGRYVDDATRQIQEIMLPARIAEGIRKPSGIRAVRDLVINEMREKFVPLSKDEKTLPRYVMEAANVMHLWRSPDRFRELFMRWRLDKGEGKAFDVLKAWHDRERHLFDYEAGARGEALRERREWYRVLASQWRKKYKTALLSDQDLAREARWGDDSDVRFIASVSELRTALTHAFGVDATPSKWKDGAPEDDEREWCERRLDQWIAEGSHHADPTPATPSKSKNAWADRKKKKKVKSADEATNSTT